MSTLKVIFSLVALGILVGGYGFWKVNQEWQVANDASCCNVDALLDSRKEYVPGHFLGNTLTMLPSGLATIFYPLAGLLLSGGNILATGRAALAGVYDPYDQFQRDTALVETLFNIGLAIISILRLRKPIKQRWTEGLTLFSQKRRSARILIAAASVLTIAIMAVIILSLMFPTQQTGAGRVRSNALAGYGDDHGSNIPAQNQIYVGNGAP